MKNRPCLQGDITNEFQQKIIQLHGTLHVLKIANWTYETIPLRHFVLPINFFLNSLPLHLAWYHQSIYSLVQIVKYINFSCFSTLNENKFIDLVLYGNDKLDDKKNHNILMSNIKFIKNSQRLNKKPAIISSVLKWSQSECYLCVYFSIIKFSFNLFSFKVFPLLRFYIYPVGYCCIFSGSIVLFV